jgi:ribonuclease R
VSSSRRGRASKRPAKNAKTAKKPPKAGHAAHGVTRARLGGQAARADSRVVWPPAARSETAREAIERLMREAGLARSFPEAVERQAERASRQRVETAGRRDMRELTTFTVDPSTARDFDDAISAQPLDGGAIKVWVHIADVAAYVPAGSPLDVEAQRRSTSVYLPGTVEPMLPHALSSDACSLVPGVERAAVTVELDLQDATATSSSFYRSLICSDERLDYERVDRIFAGLEPAPSPWGSSLAAARTAAAALAQARERKGALVVDSEEPEFLFDERGEVAAIHPRAQTESHRLIEQLMIAANEAVARHLAQGNVPCLYRVHERPDPEWIRGLVDQLHSLGVPTPPVPDPLLPAQAADLVGQISRLLDAHLRRAGHGRIALSSLLLRSLKQAYYSPTNVGHAGLHSACYCHFTSPIRRYPDLVCHRALLSTLRQDERPPATRKLPDLGEWTSEREREAVALEREGDKVAACFHLEGLLLREGYELRFAGEITGLIPGGAFVAFGPTPGVGAVYEGMLPLRLLGAETGEWWDLDERRTTLQGARSGARLRLGEPIEVRVTRVDCLRGLIDLAPAGAIGH